MDHKHQPPKRAVSPPLAVPAGSASAPHPAVPTAESPMMRSASTSNVDEDIVDDSVAPSTSLTYRDTITELKVHGPPTTSYFLLFSWINKGPRWPLRQIAPVAVALAALVTQRL
jgi:hypothetical protein